MQCPVYIESAVLLLLACLGAIGHLYDIYIYIYFRNLSHGAVVLPLRGFFFIASLCSCTVLIMCTCGYVDLVFFFFFSGFLALPPLLCEVCDALLCITCNSPPFFFFLST